jgi:predicted CopG family antitoxin
MKNDSHLLSSSRSKPKGNKNVSKVEQLSRGLQEEKNQSFSDLKVDDNDNKEQQIEVITVYSQNSKEPNIINIGLNRVSDNNSVSLDYEKIQIEENSVSHLAEEITNLQDLHMAEERERF